MRFADPAGGIQYVNGRSSFSPLVEISKNKEKTNMIILNFLLAVYAGFPSYFEIDIIISVFAISKLFSKKSKQFRRAFL